MHKKNKIIKEADVAATIATAMATEAMRIEALTGQQISDVAGGMPAIRAGTAASVLRDVATDGLVAREPTFGDLSDF